MFFFSFRLDILAFVVKEALITLLISKVLIGTISVITAASMLIVANRLQQSAFHAGKVVKWLKAAAGSLLDFISHPDEAVVTSDSGLLKFSTERRNKAPCVLTSLSPPDTRCDRVCFGFFFFYLMFRLFSLAAPGSDFTPRQYSKGQTADLPFWRETSETRHFSSGGCG